MRYVFLYVPYPTKTAAKKAASALLKKRLIACANFLPVESVYCWKGKTVKGKEVASIFKTRRSLAAAARKEIERSHPYKVPCVAVLPVGFNPLYGTWVDSETA